MSDSDMKVTDKRMFTPEGELREEYEEPRPAEASEEAPPSSAAGPGGAEPEADAGPLPQATFLDLVGMLAQGAAFHLGESGAGPELARFHIDLLEVLDRKCRGNLEDSERGALEDVLYRLRMLYVEKTAG